MQPTNKVIRGRYRIVRQLGHGGTSAVYKAFDTNRETNVALKEIQIDLDAVPSATDREILKRDFANQAKNLAKVKHESLPQLRGYFSEIDRHYLVMELVDGEDTGELLAKTKKPIELSEAINWADQLLETLDYLHTLPEPIVHGDVKPQNVLLTTRGKIKLLGFTIATENALPKMSGETAAASRYLSPGQVLRTVDETVRKNLAEKHGEKLEKVLSREVDARGDVYALGATLYHLMTAQPPLGALERLSDVWAGKPDPLSPPDKVNQELPPEVAAALMKALEIEREKRFASATAMRQALQTAITQAKEREAVAAKQEVEAAKKKEAEAALEIRQAEEKRLEAERQKIEKERLAFETEQKRQSELIARQLKTAEAERLKAEQRAAEAEKLLEKEAKKAEEEKSAVAKKAEEEKAVRKALDDAPKTGRRKTDAPAAKNLFVEDVPEKKSSWMMPAIIAAVLLAIVGVAGIVFMRSSNTAESKPLNQSQMNSTVVGNEPKPETQTQPVAEKVSETDAPPETPDATISDKTSAPPASFKNKPVAVAPPPVAPRVVKPNAPPAAKAPANQKKAVTVDDIINN